MPLELRYVPPISDWLKFPAESTANMSAPATAGECAPCQGRQVEWLFYKPASLTAYTIHFGTWVTGPEGLDAWVQMSTSSDASAGSGAKYVRFGPFTVNGDAVAAYVDTTTGTPATNMKFWYRVVG